MSDNNALSTPKPKNRCYSCNKKTGLLDFECKCGNSYCAGHRHPFDHNCTYDFKSEEIKKIRDSNPKIIAEKLIKI